jgi:hypothetical protein
VRRRIDVPAGDRHSARRRSTPARRSSSALVREQLAVAHVEGLVVDEQADDLPFVTFTIVWPDSGLP